MIRYSMFANTLARQPVMVCEPWINFVDTMSSFFEDERPATNEEKRLNTPMVSPAIYAEGSTRGNEGVQGFGGWFALDIDGGASVDDTAAILRAVPTDFCLWTTTNSKPQAHKLRAAFPVSREIGAGEARDFWAGCYEFFGHITDAQTKDPARIYGVPARWIGSEARFEFRAEGDTLDVEEVLSYAPEPIPQEPVILSKAQLRAMERGFAGCGEPTPFGQSIYECKAVSKRFVEDYLNLPKGDHHRGLYQFMTKVAGRACYLGLDISPQHLVEYARQLDAICPVKTAKMRWHTIDGEANTALRWAQNNNKNKAYVTK